MTLQYFISSSLSNLLCLISIGFLLPINTIHALNNLKLLRSFGDGYNGGVRAEAIDFQLDSVYVPNSLMYLFGQRNVSRSGFFDFRRGLVVGDITVCFASRASGTRTYDKFVCPESDDGSKANSYAELVARPSAKSYCCGPGGSQRCCTHDQYSSGDKRKPSPKDSDEKSGLSKSMIAIICVSSVTGVVLIGLVIFCICHGCRNRKPQAPRYGGQQQQPAGLGGGYAQPMPPPMRPPMPPPMRPPMPPPMPLPMPPPMPLAQPMPLPTAPPPPLAPMPQRFPPPMYHQ
uniref:CX domain-containing protein n=1 Tax=Macrostomum lignano TaxID=282301 RepID=A0A1I8GDV2_9PLAT